MQDYFKETYGRETHFIPNGVNRPEVRKAKLIRDNFGLEKDSYILFLGRLVPERAFDIWLRHSRMSRQIKIGHCRRLQRYGFLYEGIERPGEG